MRVTVVLSSILVLTVLAAETVMATPSKQIWIPSTDVQPFMLGHLDVDNYFKANRNSAKERDPNTLDIGFTLGILPFEKVQMEVGFDYLVIAKNPNDQHPWSGNAKLGTPEDSLFRYSPAIAVGLYNARPVKDIEVKDRRYVTSGQNIVYGIVAKTVPAIGAVPSLGRFSAGYYRGSERGLVDKSGGEGNTGVLLSWDRTMTELSDKLWLGIDYMGGENVNSSLNIGLAWSFTKKISLLFGYDMYQESSLSGEDSFTVQLNVDFP